MFAVPVIQPDSDYFEISLKNLGATIVSFIFDGAASHKIDVKPEQVHDVDGECVELSLTGGVWWITDGGSGLVGSPGLQCGSGRGDVDLQ